MTDETHKKLIAHMQRHLDPFADLERVLSGISELSWFAKDFDMQMSLAGAAHGHWEELRRSGALFVMTDQADAIEELQKSHALWTERFELPDFKAASDLIEAYRAGPESEIVRLFYENQDYLRLATQAMQSPWLDMEAQMRSVGAFVDIQSMGFALNNIPAFDDHLTRFLRSDLGDWQSRIDFPSTIFDDPLLRSAFYRDRGFNPALTAFPTQAFTQSLDIAGLRGAPPQRIDAYDYDEITERDVQETAFARTNAAHDRLQRFETQLRQFIDRLMTKEFGHEWVKQRVPEPIRQAWMAKRDKARASGEADHPLIAYADFTDYTPIIIQKNNWNDVFAPVFRRQTFVQESFQRLYPIRICTMHARMITQDDELYLYVEIKRVLSAIGTT